MLTRLRSLSRYWVFRLFAVTGLVMLSLLTLVLYKSATMFDEAAVAREQRHLAEFAMLVDSSLGGQLATGSVAGAADVLGRLRRHHGLDYVVLFDAFGHVLYSDGWPEGKTLPPPDTDLRRLATGSGRFDGETQIFRDGLNLGTLRYGYSLAWLNETYNAMIVKGMLIGGAVAIACLLFMALISEWLARDLHRLQQGLAAFEQGRVPPKLGTSGPAEVAQISRTFNEMVLALHNRLDALRRSEQRFHAIADYTYGAELWINPRGRLVWCNRSVERVTGFRPDEILGAADVVELLVCERDRRFAVDRAQAALRGSGAAEPIEIRLQRKDGQVAWVAVNWQAIEGGDGIPQGIRVSLVEIEERKRADLKLLDTVAELRRTQGLKDFYLNRSEEERARLKALLDVVDIGVMFVGRDHRVVYCNRALRRIWCLPEDDDLQGLRSEVLLDRTAALRPDDAAFRDYVRGLLAEHRTDTGREMDLIDGRSIAFTTDLVASQPGQYTGRVWIFEDITERRRAAEQLMQLATRDPLTGLYNRRRFYEELGRTLAEASRRGLVAGLLVIDLDGFKPVNDAFGHQAGDSVLVRLANDVGGTIRRNEMFFRLGGDEFAVLAADTSEDEMVGLARRISHEVQAMGFVFDGSPVHLTASLGIALFPAHASTGEELVARADNAMYRAKTAGKNRWHVFAEVRLH